MLRSRFTLSKQLQFAIAECVAHSLIYQIFLIYYSSGRWEFTMSTNRSNRLDEYERIAPIKAITQIAE